MSLIDEQHEGQLWVADLTFVATWAGFVYGAFVIDVFSRKIVGWRAMRGPTSLDSCPDAGSGRSGTFPRPSSRRCKMEIE